MKKPPEKAPPGASKPKSKPTPKPTGEAAPAAPPGTILAMLQRRLASARIASPRCFSTGLGVLDHAVIGGGGFPEGRIVELFGDEGSGKSSLALSIVAAHQRQGRPCVYLDAESVLDPAWATTLGVDMDRLVVIRPDHLEDVLEQILETSEILRAGGSGGLLVWDSLASTPTKAEVEEGIGGSALASDRAKALSRACRVLGNATDRAGLGVLVVNQTRATFGGGWGSTGTTTPGGAAIKFHAAVRIELMGGTYVRETDKEPVLGKEVVAVNRKNKIAAPYRKARLRLVFASGYDDAWMTVRYAKEAGELTSSAHYTEASAIKAREALGWPDPS